MRYLKAETRGERNSTQENKDSNQKADSERALSLTINDGWLSSCGKIICFGK